MTVSVIIPTRNSGRTLSRCLQSVRAQQVPLELIVVDNYSTDDTVRIAKEFRAKILTAGPERCAQRNHGLAVATGRYVLFLDSDMYLPSGALQECLTLAGDGLRAVVLTEDSTGKGYWARVKWLERRCYHHDKWIEAARFFPRELVLRLAGYDEALHAFEDWDLHRRAVKAGASIARTRQITLHDEGALSLERATRKKGYYAKSFATYAARHPVAARVQVSGVYRLALFARRFPFLIRYPHLLAGLVALKAFEALAASRRAGRHEDIYQRGVSHV